MESLIYYTFNPPIRAGKACPRHARTLHRNVRHAAGDQPFFQFCQRAAEGLVTAGLSRDTFATYRGHCTVPVDVYTTAPENYLVELDFTVNKSFYRVSSAYLTTTGLSAFNVLNVGSTFSRKVLSR